MTGNRAGGVKKIRIVIVVEKERASPSLSFSPRFGIYAAMSRGIYEWKNFLREIDIEGTLSRIAIACYLASRRTRVPREGRARSIALPRGVRSLRAQSSFPSLTTVDIAPR